MNRIGDSKSKMEQRFRGINVDEDRGTIKNTAKANKGRPIRNNNSIGGSTRSLISRAKRCVGAVMKRWPRNGQLLRRGSLQKTRVNAWEAQ